MDLTRKRLKSPLLDHAVDSGPWQFQDSGRVAPSQHGGRATARVDSFERFIMEGGGTSLNADIETSISSRRTTRTTIDELESEEQAKWNTTTIDIFCLVDKDCDKTLFKKELEWLWDQLYQIASESQQQWLEDKNVRGLQSLDQYQMRQLLHEYFGDIEQAQKVRLYLYKKKSGFFGCSPCYKLRNYLMSYRFNRKTAEEAHYGYIAVLSNFVTQMLHLFDMVTDFWLAVQMYAASRTLEEQKSYWTKWGFKPVNGIGKQYNIAFIWIMMAIFSPYIIQFSSMINAFFVKGLFEDDRWKRFTLLRRCYLILSLSFLGLAILPMLDLYIKVQSVILVLIIPLYFCKSCKDRFVAIRRYLESLYNKTFLLTFYEVESFEKQKKHTQLLFEDFLMLLLNILMFTKKLDVPILKEQNLDKKPLALQFASTFISILFTAISLYIESKGLKEPYLEFIMTSVKAKQDWVPYGSIIKVGQLLHNIDFSRLEFKIQKITDTLGLYKTFEYQFNEYSLQKLGTQILAGLDLKQIGNQNIPDQQINDNLDEKPFDAKIKFGFSVYHVSAHMFLHFIDRIQNDHPEYVENNLDLSEITWDQLIFNSFELGHFVYKGSYWCSNQQSELDISLSNQRTIGGKLLLQVCIDNENQRNFKLKPLMKLLLDKKLCDPNKLDFNEKLSLLSYCITNKKHRAFRMLVNCEQIEPNFPNKDKTTTYGVLFYQCITVFYEEKGFRPIANMKTLLDGCKGKVDIHMKSVDIMQNKVINTPIYSYFSRCYDKIQLNDQNQIEFDTRDLQKYFGQNEVILKEDVEYIELLSLFFTGKLQKKIQAFFKQNVGNIDHIFEGATDSDGNNIMHLSSAAFSDKEFYKYSSKPNFTELKPLISDLLKNPNNEGMTPIDVMLKEEPPLMRIERLLQFNLIQNGTIEHIRSDLIDYIARKVIKNQENRNLREKIVFSTLQNNEKFFRVFQDPESAYLEQKQSFTKRDYGHLFERYFKIDELEQINNSYINQLSDQQILQWEIKDNKAIVSIKIDSHKPMIQSYDENMRISISQSTQGQPQMTLSQTPIVNKKKTHHMLEACLNMLIDITSILDLISDIVIMIQLIKYKHTSWLFFSMFTMLCPYFAVYTSLMNFQIDRNKQLRNYKSKFLGCFLQVLQLLFIIPSGLAFLIGYDVLYTFANTLILPFLVFASFLTGRNLIESFENYLDKIMHIITSMNYMDIKGFRSQRTILQLQLESIPQIGLQGYMLLRLRQIEAEAGHGDNEVNKIGVNPLAIEISLLMASIHVLLEFLNLIIEASTWKTKLRGYMIACHNAKQGWIANAADFNAVEEEDRKVKENIKFDDKSEKFCGLGYSVTFNFTDLSIDFLINIISNLPKVDDSSRRNTLELGECVSELSVQKFRQLLKLSFKKINIVFSEPEVHLRKVFDKFEFKEQIRDPESYTEVPILEEMVRMNYHQVIKILIEMGAKTDLRSREDNESLLQIAFTHHYNETLIELLQLAQRGHSQEKYVKDSILEKEMFYDDIFLRDDKKKKPLCPTMLLQPSMLIPYEMQQSLLYNIPRLIRMNEDVARDQFDTVFGAFLPQFIFKVGDEIESALPILEKWLKRYPARFTVCISDQQVSLESTFLCSFVGFRKLLYKLKLQDRDIIQSSFNRVIDIEHFEFDLQSLIDVYHIVNGMNVENLKIVDTDYVIKKFGLDKMRDIYFHRSRELLNDQRDLTKGHVQEVQVLATWQVFQYHVDPQVLAIKSFQLVMDKSGLQEPLPITLYVEYNTGHQKTELKPALELLADPNNSTGDEITLLDIKYGSAAVTDKVSLVKLYQTLLMNVQGGHTLIFKFKPARPPAQDRHYSFHLKFEFYLDNDPTTGQ